MAEGKEEDKGRKRGMRGTQREGERVVVKLNDRSVRIIIDDSGSVNY